MIHEPELPMRPLQNHLPLDRHFTTQAGFCTPQYLQTEAAACVSCMAVCPTAPNCTAAAPSTQGLTLQANQLQGAARAPPQAVLQAGLLPAASWAR